MNDEGKCWPTVIFYALTGAALIGLTVALRRLSPQFIFGGDELDQPIILTTALSMIAGAAYWLAVVFIKHPLSGRAALTIAFGVGLLMRLLMFGSTPILEDDAYRYLWDGAVVVNGQNPYRYSPEEINREAPQALQQLAEQSGDVIERINHPKLRTLYPPTAQLFFAAGHLVKPFDLDGLRVIWLLLDLGVLVLLSMLLREMDLPLGQLVIYWWNPLLVREIYNAGHMELTVLPFLVAAVWLMLRSRPVWASALLAWAFGAKFWPIVLLPLFLRRLFSHPRVLMAAALTFILIAVAIIWPMHVDDFSQASGAAEYARRWEMNDTLYMAPFWLAKQWTDQTDLAHGAARGAVSLIVIAVIAWQVRRSANDGGAWIDRALVVLAVLFLLSPAQFPWYALWLTPFLAVRPRASLLLLTVLTPMYYLRFYFQAVGRVDVFDHGVVWLEFTPIWLWWLGETIWRRVKRTSIQIESLSGF